MRFALERLYAIYVIIFMSSAFLGLSVEPVQAVERSPGTAAELALQVISFVPAGILVLVHRRSFLPGLRDCKWAVAVLLLAFLSSIWAADPSHVLRKSAILAANSAFAIYFGTRYTRAEQIGLLSYALALVAIMSVLAVLAFPLYGIDHATTVGAWRGIYATKNVFGKIMVLGLLTFSLSPLRWLNTVAVRFIALIVFGLLIILSESKTALLVGVALLIVISLHMALRSRHRLAVAGMALLVLSAAVIVVIGNSDLILPFLERDETFTGRGPLWVAVLNAIGRRPLLGYGFMSFWNGTAGPSASVVDAVVGWVPPHAHNGFLDLCLDLGVAGLLLVGAAFVFRFRTAIAEYHLLRRATAMWPFALLTFLVLYNLTESSLLRVNFLWWALFMAALVRNGHCGRHVEDARESMSTHNVGLHAWPA